MPWYATCAHMLCFAWYHSNDMVERGRSSLSMSTRLTTAASPTRTGKFLKSLRSSKLLTNFDLICTIYFSGLGSINMNTKLEDLRSASPVYTKTKTISFRYLLHLYCPHNLIDDESWHMNSCSSRFHSTALLMRFKWWCFLVFSTHSWIEQCNQHPPEMN